ncbi:MAG TPA: sialate O-acetylesterase [Acidobacteriaceae bacterium]|nr:sialate O-acetylesterase [Acidobacteriaceae bacterium]
MKKTDLLFSAVLVFFLAFTASPACAEVTLPHMLSDHMVLQRDRPIHLWGWADPGEKVTATLHGASGSTEANGIGHWSLYLPPEPAGGPYTVTISGTNTITLTDVMIGDVWFASGQSNMQLPLMGFPGSAVVTNGHEEIRNATQPELRLLHIPAKASPYPQQDQAASWTLCTPKTAATFSAAAYFFGREIARREHVTVGLIDSSYGGTPGEAWISMDTIGSDAALMPIFAYWAHVSDSEVDFARIDAEQKREADAAKAAGNPAPWHMWRPNDIGSWAPAWLYNAMVAPAVNYPIKGVIWYQGETNSNIERAAMYQRIFPALINDWRKQWQEGNFPFLFVQISAFTSVPEENWAVIREAQRRTLSIANTAMAVTIDIGNPTNVHPADKQDVGHRLALAALALAYGEHIEYSGPLYRQATVNGHAMQIWFTHTTDGLIAKGSGLLKGFEIAGSDHKFVLAEARIDGDTVLVSSPDVPDPAYVRYGWANYPVVNLVNGVGLPASPFTTEKNIPKP